MAEPFDRVGQNAPLFAFRHGVSYASFGYANLAIMPGADGTIDVAFDVTISVQEFPAPGDGVRRVG